MNKIYISFSWRDRTHVGDTDLKNKWISAECADALLEGKRVLGEFMGELVTNIYYIQDKTLNPNIYL